MLFWYTDLCKAVLKQPGALQYKVLSTSCDVYNNSAHHHRIMQVVMYYYYHLTAVGKSPWWKKHITTMQILQFTSGCGNLSLPSSPTNPCFVHSQEVLLCHPAFVPREMSFRVCDSVVEWCPWCEASSVPGTHGFRTL